MYQFIPCTLKIFSLGIIAQAFCFYSFCQPTANTVIWKKLISIEKDTAPANQRLQQVRLLKKQFEDQHLAEDSVYARILHRIGQLASAINNGIATKEAIDFTLAALKINNSGKANSSRNWCVNSYANLGNFYKSLQIYDVAARYYDSAILLRKQFPGPLPNEINLRTDKGRMLTYTGDYQKAIEDFNIAIIKTKAEQDSSRLVELLVLRAQSYITIRRMEEALKDVNAASELFTVFKSTLESEMINNIFMKAGILAQRKDYSEALRLYKKGVALRLKTNDYVSIVNDYLILGYFFLTDLHNFIKAKQFFVAAIPYGKKSGDPEIMAKINLNLEAVSFFQHKYKDAEHYYLEALKNLKLTTNGHILANPPGAQLNAVSDKELLLILLTNKTDLLLNQFMRSKDKKYLSACLQTALLTDTIISNIRHEQSGEESKLYWRNQTREFFTHAIEACWLANDARLAFYFMEKSRAALLNDKLNELRASAQLPEPEAEKELGFRIAVKLEELKPLTESNESDYDAQQLKVLEAKAELEHYTRSLEKRYPAYYQNKYADEVPSLNEMQKYLRENRQSFVQYFINDTTAYILAITAGNTKMVKLSKDDFNSGQLINFLQLCANVPALQNQYEAFVSLSNSIYKLLFLPLSIPKGKVVISPDNFLIPFDALCTDRNGNKFLIEEYAFSYVYSARYLFRKFKSYNAKGDFLGIAPVSFKAYPAVVDLKGSAKALKQSGRYYSNTAFLINDLASRSNFINHVAGYTIVNIFSHAMADTTGNEPELYMHDSVVHLSELQLLHNPATSLIVLSACKTNVGKSAKGEGIFSLARGFALAGIPSVAATLWQADEQSIYVIAEKFHENLSKGMPKDEALQKAKLFFMQNSDHVKTFPYYWANMILIGNDDPIRLSAHHFSAWWIAGIISVIAIILLIVKFLKMNSSKGPRGAK